jgi:DNA polymerase I-like protein with 3'-5' exonuclease and polymerase domains
MAKIAIIDKCPSRNNYKKYFDFEFDQYHMSSVQLTKLLKKDVDIVIDIDQYDFIITVGSEATKMYAKVGVSNFAGILVDDKFLPLGNPAQYLFKPEGLPEFERSVKKIIKYITGELSNVCKTGDFKGIQDEEEARNFLLEVLYQPDNTPTSLDCETTALAPRDGYMLGLSLSYKLAHGRYISTDCMNDTNVELLQMICDKHTIVFHNRKFDQKWFEYHFNIKFKADSHDTMVMHYALDETQGSHGLKVLALKHTAYGQYDEELDTYKKMYCKQNGIKIANFTYDLIPFEIMWPYASMDSAVTLELFYKFWPIVSQHPKLCKLYTEILIPATLFLMQMEENGIPMSRKRLEAASGFLDKEIEEAKQKVYSFEAVKQFEYDSGKIFNPNSVQQLRTVLFTYLRLKPTGKLTDTGAISTDAEVLGKLAEEHELPAAILVVRKLSKIKNTYVSKILPALDRDEHIRTNFNLIFTTSGRLSSSGRFNAQQIPRDDPIIKGCITADPGWKLISQDLSTAEVYYAAVLSKDKKMQGIFLAGGDFHSATAKLVFNLPCDVSEVKKLYPTMRQAAKAVNKSGRL